MAAVAGGLAWALSHGLPEAAGSAAHLGRELLVVAIPAAVGVALYATGLWLFRVEEMRVIQRRLLALAGR